jgi:hypothetical protein
VELGNFRRLGFPGDQDRGAKAARWCEGLSVAADWRNEGTGQELEGIDAGVAEPPWGIVASCCDHSAFPVTLIQVLW